jgi:hypothetical protein
MLHAPGPQTYGPNSRAVWQFIDRVRRLRREEGDRIRHAYLVNEGPPASGGRSRAAVTTRVIEAAVRARRKEEHRRAILDCRAALAASGAGRAGMGVHLGDLAGALVVRDLIGASDFDYLAFGWRDTIGRAVADASALA